MMAPRIVDGEAFSITQSMLRTGSRRWFLRPWATRLAGCGALALAYQKGALPTVAKTFFAGVGTLAAGMYLANLCSATPTSADGSAMAGLVIPWATMGMDRAFRDVRKELLKNVQGRVLDVGCAAGAYLKYYAGSAQRVTEVVALEPNQTMHGALRRTIAGLAQKARGLPFPVVVTAKFLEQLPPEENASFDSIVLGNVLCEVPDVAAALREVDRLLKPGGRVYFSEHVLDAPGSWRRAVQQSVNPWWSVAAAGCHCNRDSLTAIRAVPGWEVEHWTFSIGGPLVWLDRFEVGLAVKRRGPVRSAL